MRTLFASVCLLVLLRATAAADASTYRTSTGISYSAADALQAVQAVLRVPTDDGIIVLTETYPANQLPTWDPIAHYEGPKQLPDGRIAYAIVLSDRYSVAMQDLAHARHAVAVAVASAEFMAVMDAGRAGSKWKSLFDRAAAADAKLAPTVHDRYDNRHALVAQLADSQTVVYASIGGGTVIVDSAGSPLTETIDYGSGLIGAARLGVGDARVIELLENPDGLQKPAAQAFVSDWFKHFASILPTEQMRTFLKAQRSLLVVTPTADLGANQRRFDQAISSLTQGMDTDVALSFGVGLEVSEARYNATVIRHGDEDNELRDVIGRTDALDATLPGLKETRVRLAALPAGDWAEITSLSSAMIRSILSGP